MADVAVRPVRTDQEMQAFLRMPWTVYKDNPHWTAPLWSEHVKFFDPKHNVELKHIDLEKFIAWRGDTPVGTCVAFVNHAYNKFQEKNTGWFGQIEWLDDKEAAHALLSTAEEWVRAKGVDTLMGPSTFSTNSEIGLLIKGHTEKQMILSPYAQSYSQALVESYPGLNKTMDLWYWQFDANKWGGKKADQGPEKLMRVAEKIKARKNFNVRHVDMSHFREEVERVKTIYNSAWEKNWGFVPMDDEEIDHLAKGLKDMVDPDIAVFVEVNGKPIAFGLAIPDLYEPMRNARLKPGEPELLQLLRFLWQWKVVGKRGGVRVWALGVLEEYRASGVDALIYYELLLKGLKKGYYDLEMSWILENNDKMNAILEMLGAHIYKIYRVYEKKLK